MANTVRVMQARWADQSRYGVPVLREPLLKTSILAIATTQADLVLENATQYVEIKTDTDCLFGFGPEDGGAPTIANATSNELSAKERIVRRIKSAEERGDGATPMTLSIKNVS